MKTLKKTPIIAFPLYPCHSTLMHSEKHRGEAVASPALLTRARPFATMKKYRVRMAYSLKQLRELTDDELIKKHDEVSQQTIMGMNYFLDELKRREQDRLTNTMLKYTRLMLWFTVFVALCTVVNVIVALCPR